MRILQLCTKVPFPPKDGGAAGVYVFSQALVGLGHTVDILAVNPPKHFISKESLNDLHPNIRIHPVAFDTRPGWIKAVINLVGSNKPYQTERFVDKRYCKELVNILVNEKPDIVQIEGVYLCPYLPVIRKYSKAGVVLRAHNIEFNLWNDIAGNADNLLKKWYLEIQVRRLKKYELSQFMQVDGITTVTENDLAIIKNYKPEANLCTIPFGVDVIVNQSDVGVNTDSIFFLGALDWIPNQEACEWFVNEVWPLIRMKFPKLQFHIAGRNAPKQLIDFFENTEGIVFHGEIPDAGAFIGQFSIMVCPLFSGSGIRVKIIEAMQYGKVVVASTKAAQGIPAIVGEHLILADSPQEFVDQLGSVLSDTERVRCISAKAVKFVNENFNILAIASKLTEFYNKVRND